MFELKTEACEVGGHMKVRVTVSDVDGRMVEGELVSPFNGRQRRAAAVRMAGRVASSDALEATADEIERRVLEAANHALGEEAPRPAGAAATGEVTLEAEDLVVVRPEGFVTPSVVGVSVPETVLLPEGGLNGRWRFYLTTPADGRRWTVPLEQSIAVPGVAPDGLWVRPVPANPALPAYSGWGTASRRDWLRGKVTPTAREVFAAVYETLDEYLDVGQGEGKSETRNQNDESSPNAQTPECANGLPAPSFGHSDIQALIRHSDFVIRHSAPHPVLSTLALWTMLTYCFPAWDAVPYLYVGGPAGSGKTRVFEILSRLVFRPLMSSNVSAPALFRTLHERGGTLLLDEAERLKEGAPEVAEIRSILLAGYKRGGKASRLESSGETYRMQDFDVYGPKAIACINGVEGPLATRCIGVQMIRSAPDSPKPRRRIDRDPSRWQRLRDMLYECLLGELGKESPSLAERPDLCPLGGRSGEIWQPLLALATLADPEGKWGLQRVLTAHAIELAEAAKDEHFPEEELALLTILTKKVLAGETPTATELLKACQMKDAAAFGKWRAQKVGSSLKLYGITSTKGNRGRLFIVPLDHLKILERNYGIDLNTEGRVPKVLIGSACAEVPPQHRRS